MSHNTHNEPIETNWLINILRCYDWNIILLKYCNVKCKITKKVAFLISTQNGDVPIEDIE